MTIARRPRRSAAQWNDIVEQFHDSGMSEEEFCQQHDLGLVSLRKWRYRKTNAPQAHTTQSPSSFTPVDVLSTDQVISPTSGIQIHLGSEVHIDCQSQPIEVIAQLALAVRHGR